MSGKFNPNHGFGTLVIHTAEDDHPYHSNVTPIYQSSIFRMPDVETGVGIVSKEIPGYFYSRINNPNFTQVGEKLAVLEGIDLLRADPERPYSQIVAGRVYASGMAAITTAVLACVHAGQTIIAQQALYSRTYEFMEKQLTALGVKTIWISDPKPEAWAKAFEENRKPFWLMWKPRSTPPWL